MEIEYVYKLQNQTRGFWYSRVFARLNDVRNFITHNRKQTSWKNPVGVDDNIIVHRYRVEYDGIEFMDSGGS